MPIDVSARPAPRPRWPRWIGALLVVAAAPGCDLFEELQDAPGAETGDAETGTESGSDTEAPHDGGPCEIAEDDACYDQDTLASCDPSDGTLRVVSCAELCGSYTNFSCVGTGTGQHACWCVEPGLQKVLSCGELEACLGGCGSDTLCMDDCFTRTVDTTIRIYGAVLHCAETHCEATCKDTPETCSQCVTAAIASGAGGCTLERALCDDDRNDEPDPW